MARLPFRCSVASSDSAINGSHTGLCLNGGVCRVNPDTLEQFCECPPGFSHDFIFGHFKNCAMRPYTWAIVTGVTAALTIVSLLVTIPAIMQVRAQVRSLLITGAMATIFNLGFMIAIWAQNGAYTAAFVMLLIFNVLAFRSVMGSVRVFTLPAYAVLQRDMDKFNFRVNVMEWLNFLSQFASLVPMVVYTKDKNPDRYNFAALLFLCFYAFGLDVLGILVIYQVRTLKKQIENLSLAKNSTRETQLTALKNRIDKFYKGHILLFGALMIATTLPILLGSLGSIPGQYVLMFMLNMAVPCFVALFAFLYSQNRSFNGPDTGSTPKVEDNVLSLPLPSANTSAAKRDTA